MADINLTNGEAYVFAKINDKPVILRGTDNAHLATTDIRSDLKVTGGLGVGDSPAMSAEIHVSSSSPLIILEKTSDHFLTLGVANTGDTTLIGFHDDKSLEIGPLATPNTQNITDPAMTIHNNGAVTIGEYHSNYTSNNARPLNLDTADISGELYVQGNASTDVGSALIAAMGRNQGDGILYAGQDVSFGGGILFKGSDKQAEFGNFGDASNDYLKDKVCLYRTDSGTATPVAYWHYNSNTVNFVADIADGVSDERLKENVREIDNAIEKIKQIRGVYHDYNSKAVDIGYLSEENVKLGQDKNHVGVIAQEVQKVLPEVVQPAPADNNYLTVAYDKMVPLLIEGIKEQQKQIDDLKAQLETLK
jgi:hypothetical protein